MATSSSSLVVKISADITDFSKQLDKATRTVDQAAKKIAGFGTALTVGITLPVLGAAAALAKMAAENEDTAGRMERVFGSAASSVNASIQTMMKSVPEANTELQKMAISVDNMAQGLGIAPSNAAKMSESLLKLAGDAAAFAPVPMEQALDALSRGLAGKTKGLLEFGIAISEADIKAKALSMGLVHQGNDLTETGTALASYALIMERSSRIQGEAERTAGQMGKQFQFLKRDLGELADNVSGLVLPALSDLAKKARDVVAIFAGLDQSTVKTFFEFAAAAALIGPVIIGIARLVDVVFKLRAAFALLGAGGTVAGFFGALAALPITTIVAGIAAITAALGGLYYIWSKFKGGTSALTAPLSNDPALAAAVGAQNGALAGNTVGKNAPTERAPIVDPLKAMEERAKLLTDAFKHMGDGWEIPDLTRDWVLLLGKAQAQYDGIKDKTSDIANRLREIISSISDAAAKATNSASDLATIAKLTPQSAGALGVQATRPGVQIDPKIAAVGEAFSRSGLAAAAALDREAAIVGEIDVEYATLRNQLGQFGISIGFASERVRTMALQMVDAAKYFASQLVANVGGKGPAAGTGRGIGGILGTVAGTFFGGPLGGIVGGFLGTAAGGLVGSLFDHPKKAADQAATSLDTLSKTVDKVTESITNVPAFFKVQTYRFEAAPIIYRTPSVPAVPTPTGGTPIPTPNPTGGSDNPFDPKGGSKNGNMIFNGDIHVSGVPDVKALLSELQELANTRRGTGTAARFALSGIG